MLGSYFSALLDLWRGCTLRLARAHSLFSSLISDGLVGSHVGHRLLCKYFRLRHLLRLLELETVPHFAKVLLKLAFTLASNIHALEELIDLVITLIVEPAVVNFSRHFRLNVRELNS